MTTMKDWKLGALFAALSLTVACAPAEPSTSFSSNGNSKNDDDQDDETGDSSDKKDDEEDESEGSPEDEQQDDDDTVDSTSSGSTTGGEATSDGGTTSTSTSTTGDLGTTTNVDPTNATTGGADPTSTESATAGTLDMQAIAPDDMIDDFEDGNIAILGAGGRAGYWYIGDDTTGTTSPASNEDLIQAGGPVGTQKLVFSGSGFTDWGAYLGFPLASDETYDLTGYTGIAFLARGKGTIDFKVNTSDIIPVSRGGTCDAAALEEGQSCDIGHAFSITLKDTWEQYLVPFAMLEQPTWGNGVDFIPANAIGVQWQAPAGAAFEIQLDDVGLY